MGGLVANEVKVKNGIFKIEVLCFAEHFCSMH